MQVKEVTSYSFYEFCRDAQEAILQGYRFDFDSNANFPQQFGSMLTAILVKEENIKKEPAGELVGVAAEFELEDKPAVKPGRKPRA